MYFIARKIKHVKNGIIGEKFKSFLTAKKYTEKKVEIGLRGRSGQCFIFFIALFFEWME